MRLSVREQLTLAKRNRHVQTVMESWEDFYKLLVDGDRPPAERRVNPTQMKLWTSSEKVRAYKGPAGCAKTSTIVADVLMRALVEPGTKHFIGRQDYNDLLDTTAARAIEMMNRLPQGTLVDKRSSPPMKWWVKPIPSRGPDGTVDESISEITFMGMKDVMKGSFEFAGGCLDEADEMDEKAVLGLISRFRSTKGTMYLDLAFNPPSEDHWLYTACTGKNAHGEQIKEPIFALFEPQPKENVRNLRPGYYEDMTALLPEDMRQRLVDGAWGSCFPGDPVVRQFRQQVHVRSSIPYGGGTLYRFWDFGYRRPYVCFCQLTKTGRLMIMEEHLGMNQEVEAFAADVLRMSRELFPDAKAFVDYGDPAVKQHKDTGSALARFREAGIMLRFQATPFDVSLGVLRKRFELMVEGLPAITIARRCRVLVNALAGGYHLKEDGVTPHKDGYYDHCVDALRYGCWNIWGATSSVSTTGYAVQSIAYWSEAENERHIQRSAFGANGGRRPGGPVE